MQTEEEMYEKELLTSFEKGEWQTVANVKNKINRYVSTAAAALLKDKRINIRCHAALAKVPDVEPEEFDRM